MKKCLLQLLVLLLASVPAVAQTVSGRVTNSADGTGLPGVSVLVKGTTTGTTTDTDGKYSISPSDPANAVLVFSFIGFASQEVPVGNKSSVDVSLSEDITQLGEVVVTALGIERETKSLTYSVQEVKGEQLTNVRDANFMNSLSGKVAGVFINKSTSGVGGSTRVVLRGQKSTRENQPLYVVDGVPLANFTGAQPSDVWGQSSGAGSGGRDGGDVLSTINPSDIESITVLKGAAASALYGSQAGNGVILITTKKGKAGSAKIDFNSYFTVEKPLYTPDLQYQYAQTNAGNVYSWGPKESSPDHVEPFFKTGTTWVNTIGLTAGNEIAQSYFSYSNTSNNGIVPTSSLDQHTFNFRESAKFLNNKLSADANVMFSTQKVHNRPQAGLYYNPLTGLYLFPRGLDFDDYKNNYSYFSETRNTNLQNWWNINHDAGQAGQDNQQNPYWILNRNANDGKKDNLFGSLTLKYALTDWLTVQARGSVNRNLDTYELKAFASTQGTLADANGRYTLDKLTSTLLYGDLLLMGNRDLTDKLALTFNIGTSVNDLKQDREFSDSKGADLRFANVFTVSNINATTAATINPTGTRRQIQSVFGTANLGYDEKIYLDLTLRNDWSSTLAYTPKMKKGYPYYSAGINTVISEIFELPELINFTKLRFTYAKVGNDVAPFATLPTNTIVTTNYISAQAGPKPGTYLKPERTQSIEAGLEGRFLNNRLTLDFTWYRSNTKDQYIEFGAPLGSGFARYYVNAGNIQNSGIEAMVGYDVIKNSSLTWNASLNFTRNVNKVVELLPELGGIFEITAPGVNNYALRIKEGGRFGDIYGKKFNRATDGSIIVDETGKPSGDGKFDYLGNPTPNFLLGWNNSLQYKNFTFNLLIDGRFGGKVMSITQAMLDEYGVSQATADARNNGGVSIFASTADGEPFTDKISPEIFYTAVGGRAGITENYMYDATNVRVRELSIGYRLPIEGKYMKNVNISLVGRNLFFITKKAPFDPEISMSTGNGLQGVDVFALPSTRSMGLNVRWSF
jgi:TonB-linked SusC/RagA family outer membrane protein